MRVFPKGSRNEAERQLKSRNGRLEDLAPESTYDYETERKLREKHNDKWEELSEKFYNEINLALQHYSQLISKLPHDSTSPGIIQPHIPILVSSPHLQEKSPDGVLTSNKFKHAGIKSVYVSNFFFLEDQLLLGINYGHLSKEYAPMESFRKEETEIIKRKKEIEDKINDVLKAQQELRLLDKEIAHLIENVDVASVTVSATPEDWADPDLNKDWKDGDTNYSIAPKTSRQARQDRIDALVESRNRLQTHLNQLQITHQAELTEYDDIKAKLSLHRTANSDVVKEHKIDKNFTEKLLRIMLDCLAQINANLSENEKLVFPETGVNYTKMDRSRANTPVSTVIPKGTPPKPRFHGSMAYFWVMKVRTLHRLKDVLGDATIELHNWALPQSKEKSIVHKAIEKEAKSVDNFADVILNYYRQGISKEQAFTKAKVFLIKQHKSMDDYFSTMFEKVWSEAKEVIEEMQEYDEKNPMPEKRGKSKANTGLLASSLLSVKN